MGLRAISARQVYPMQRSLLSSGPWIQKPHCSFGDRAMELSLRADPSQKWRQHNGTPRARSD
jgi:hypothetical protein